MNKGADEEHKKHACQLAANTSKRTTNEKSTQVLGKVVALQSQLQWKRVAPGAQYYANSSRSTTAHAVFVVGCQGFGSLEACTLVLRGKTTQRPLLPDIYCRTPWHNGTILPSPHTPVLHHSPTHRKHASQKKKFPRLQPRPQSSKFDAGQYGARRQRRLPL